MKLVIPYSTSPKGNILRFALGCLKETGVQEEHYLCYDLYDRCFRVINRQAFANTMSLICNINYKNPLDFVRVTVNGNGSIFSWM